MKYTDFKVIPYSGQFAIVGYSDKHNTVSKWDFIDRFGVKLYSQAEAQNKVSALKGE